MIYVRIYVRMYVCMNNQSFAVGAMQNTLIFHIKLRITTHEMIMIYQQ